MHYQCQVLKGLFNVIAVSKLEKIIIIGFCQKIQQQNVCGSALLVINARISLKC